MPTSRERPKNNLAWIGLPAGIGAAIFLILGALGAWLSPNAEIQIDDWPTIVVWIVGALFGAIGVLSTVVWFYVMRAGNPRSV